MKRASWIVGLLLLLPLWGCGDECFNVDRPTGATCDDAADCSEIDCNGICEADGSGARGAAFCEDSLCTCPCGSCGAIEYD